MLSMTDMLLKKATSAAVKVIIDSNNGVVPCELQELYSVAEKHELSLVLANLPGLKRAVLTEDQEGNRVAIIPWDKDRWHTYTLAIHEITEHILRRECSAPIHIPAQTLAEHQANCHNVSTQVQHKLCRIAQLLDGDAAMSRRRRFVLCATL